MPDLHADDNRVDELAEEFARRWRAGERPSVDEYTARYPQWADEIRDVFPAVALMEQLKPVREDDRPPAAPPADLGRPPERIGEFSIVREIGRGGMGVVYEAVQESLGRRVALKVLPAHLLANEKLRSRFHRESQAAARLHHTNIVPVFGVGEHDGLCYYVMQLIPGRSLDGLLRGGEWTQDDTLPQGPTPDGEGDAHGLPRSCAGTEKHGPEEENTSSCLIRADPCQRSSAFIRGRSDPSSAPAGPSPKAVARIGVQVADALAYAHSQGVLHRDIKPSNLILDDRGAVWVTDFGVAKLVEEANLTQSGDLVGTLKYMPPERFAGQSDARGDVYGLGVTLYELLAQRPAFPDTTPHHLIQLITQSDPPRLRKLNHDVPPDLETVILKAAARDPAQRYPSAAEFAEDLRRFLDDRPILARRAGPAEQAWRWCRRNPALAASVLTTFLLLVMVTVVSVVAYVRTAAANRDATNALAAEQAQREHAEATATLALGALNRMYDRFAPTRLVATAPSTDADGVELPPQPSLPPEAVPLLEDLLRTYQQIAHSGGEFPRLQAQAAEANHRIGDIHQRLGRYEDAAAAYRAAIDLYTHLAPGAAEDSVRIKLARACNELGRTLRALRQPEEADRLFERAIRTLTDAPPALAGRPEYRYELARVSFSYGQRDQLSGPPGGGPGPPPGEPGRGRPGPGRRGRPGPDRPPGGPGGEHPARRAALLLEQLVREFPAVPEYRHLLACCYRDTPPDRPGRGQPLTGANADRAVELLRQLVAEFPKVPDYRFDLCETLRRMSPPDLSGNPKSAAQARGRLEEAVSLSGELVTQYPNVPQYAFAHAQSLDLLGITLSHAHDLSAAEQAHRKAVALQTKLVRQYPDVVAYGFWLGLMERSLGRVLSERGELPEARSRLESAVARLEALPTTGPRRGPGPPVLGTAYRELAEVLARSGETERAAQAHRKAEELSRQRGPGPFGPRERGERP